MYDKLVADPGFSSGSLLHRKGFGIIYAEYSMKIIKKKLDSEEGACPSPPPRSTTVIELKLQRNSNSALKKAYIFVTKFKFAISTSKQKAFFFYSIHQVIILLFFFCWGFNATDKSKILPVSKAILRYTYTE